MFQVEIAAESREVFGKGPMRRLRAEGVTPAVVYGAGGKALPLQIDTKTLMSQLLEFSKVNTVVNLKIEENTVKSVLIGEIQSHPVTDTLIHVDFCEIDLQVAREFTVPVVFAGTPKGVDLGGLQENHVSSLVIKALPLDVPNEISVDVSNLAIDENIVVSDLELADNITVITPGKKVMVAVIKL